MQALSKYLLNKQAELSKGGMNGTPVIHSPQDLIAEFPCKANFRWEVKPASAFPVGLEA